MRDFVSCYGDHAVKVADLACSGSGRGPVSHSQAGAQSGVTCLYRSRLSSSREFIIRVSWTKSQAGQNLALAVEDLGGGGGGGPVLLRKKKGSRSFTVAGAMIGLYWDITSARYEVGPEPVDGYYVAVMAEDEVTLLIGDLGGDQLRMLPKSDFGLVGRREQVVGASVFCTRACFGDGGRQHEISIRCKADEDTDAKQSELCVFIDKKKVVHVRHLWWNFRGNQTIFVDGLPIDMMWDVCNWCFSHGGDRTKGHSSDRAVFLFRTRSALESRLWLEEEMLQKGEHGKSGFSLLIHALRVL